MPTNRRTFLKLSAMASGGVLGLMRRPVSLAEAMSSVSPAAKSLNILILGGTGFIGPPQIHYAVRRGHGVTIFNRGKTASNDLPTGVERLIGDRNGQLDALKGRKWDVVIDNPTIIPIWVRDAAQVLQGSVDRYVYISTIMVYPDGATRTDENAPMIKYEGADPMKETEQTLEAKYSMYGPLKAVSEAETQRWFPNKSLIIRPGIIVGPNDPSDRFTYWPARIARGGQVLAPGTGDDAVQFIDVRDLAEWTIRMIEQGTLGIFNAVGPRSALTMKQMLEDIAKATKSNAELKWLPADFLSAQKVKGWDMPMWSPAGRADWFFRIDNRKAIDKGLTFRSIADTSRTTLDWLNKQPAERQSHLLAGMSAEREAALLAAWQQRK